MIWGINSCTGQQSSRATHRQRPVQKDRKKPQKQPFLGLFWRKRWDSNPRALADNRISSAARYDHFDTLPYKIVGVIGENVTRFRVLHLRPLGQLSKAIPCQHLQTAIIIIIRTYQKKSIGYFKKEKRDWKNQSLLQWWTLTDLNC